LSTSGYFENPSIHTKGRDDRSSGIEIRIAEAVAKINPTDPLILAKQAREEIEIVPIPLVTR
jgi:hypothetical protein